MEKFCKIQPIEFFEDFTYGENNIFSLQGLQEDGSKLISYSNYLLLKDTEQFKTVDFENKIWYELSSLNFKDPFKK